MARFSDLPVELVEQILEHFRVTYIDDSATVNVAQVNRQWADILRQGFCAKYSFLEESFVLETWLYLILNEEAFLRLSGHPYPQHKPSKRSSRDYCMVWIRDFQAQKAQMTGKPISCTEFTYHQSTPEEEITRKKENGLERTLGIPHASVDKPAASTLSWISKLFTWCSIGAVGAPAATQRTGECNATASSHSETSKKVAEYNADYWQYAE